MMTTQHSIKQLDIEIMQPASKTKLAQAAKSFHVIPTTSSDDAGDYQAQMIA